MHEQVGPLGFELDDRKLKRAGLDYWEYVAVRVHADWEVRLGHRRLRTGVWVGIWCTVAVPGVAAGLVAA